MAPIVAISTELRGNFTTPSCPLMVPVGLGISLILKVALSLTLLPSGMEPDTLIVTTLTVPGFITYLPISKPLIITEALANKLLSDIRAKEIVIGFATTRYTKFILSAEIVDEFGLDKTT